jgi:hypothetical protein
MANRLLTPKQMNEIIKEMNKKMKTSNETSKTNQEENPKVYTLTLSVKNGKSKSIDFVEKDGVLIDDVIIKFLLASFFQHE